MKRAWDILAAATLLILTAPLFALTALAVRVNLGSPILFRQRRPGRHAVPFEMYKFRTMRDSPVDGPPLPDRDRLTGLGRFLRAASLDELPELFNVLRGDMSLVGPRPLLMAYLPLYDREQSRRHEVRPGITGWAQVNGRNAISWEEKFKLDVWYVDHRSLAVDLKILAMTVWRVLRRSGIDQREGVTMEPFLGTKHSEGVDREGA